MKDHLCGLVFRAVMCSLLYMRAILLLLYASSIKNLCDFHTFFSVEISLANKHTMKDYDEPRRSRQEAVKADSLDEVLSFLISSVLPSNSGLRSSVFVVVFPSWDNQ